MQIPSFTRISALERDPKCAYTLGRKTLRGHSAMLFSVTEAIQSHVQNGKRLNLSPLRYPIPSATMFHSVPPVLLLSVLFCIYCLYEKVSRAVHKALVSLSPFGFVLWHWGQIPGPHVSSTAALAQNPTSALSVDSNSPSSVKLVFQ